MNAIYLFSTFRVYYIIVRYFLVNLWNNVLCFNSLKVYFSPQSYNTWRTTHLYWVMKFPNYFIIINWWYSSLFVLYFYNIKSHLKYCKFTKHLQNFTTLMINWFNTVRGMYQDTLEWVHTSPNPHQCPMSNFRSCPSSRKYHQIA